ncbi:MAG TPA: hypothetical protein PLN02_03105 [Azonexus sp.]|nr:hypothetical protein [Azonexus sp.]
MSELYEKLYFHEIEIRDKLVERLQVPLALIVSLMGALVYMLQNTALESPLPILVPYFFVLAVPAILLIATAVTFFLSYYNYSYGLIPTAEQLEAYRQQLLATYTEFDNGQVLAEKYHREALMNAFVECSTINAATNAKRGGYIHTTNTLTLISAIFLLIAFVFFYLGGLDKNGLDTPKQIVISKPIELRR